MSKLKVDELRSADRSVSSSANITLADDGNVSLGGTLSAGTIGGNVVFPDGTPTKINVYKYNWTGATALHQNSAATWKVATRTSSSDATVQSFTHKAGYTYLFDYRWYAEAACDGSATTNRVIYYILVCEGTDRSYDDTAPTSNMIGRIDTGRYIHESSSATAASLLALQCMGAKYFSSAGTEYVYLTSYATSNVNAKTYQRDDYPMYLTITEIKGNFTNNT